MDEQPPLKRKFNGAAMASKKAPKLASSGAGGGGKMSFAQKMMAKMGYVEGQGLGREGEGMVNPIEVKLRPQGAGVGTIKEKTEQYKEEQKRAAERRGEEFEDSSEEERRKRRERKKKTQAQGFAGGGSGTSTPGGARRPKPKYRTVADVQAAAPGLDVPPQMLSSIIDATGGGMKMLTSAAGLMTPASAPTDSEAEKIAKRERLELEAFIEAWHGIQEQKIYIEEHAGQHQVELDQKMDDLTQLQTITAAIEDLRLTGRNFSTEDEDTSANLWNTLIDKLEIIQRDYRHDITRFGLSDAAVGAITPLFKERLADWEPLQKPDKLVADLQRLSTILGLQGQDEVVTVNSHADLDDAYGKSRRQKSTTTYETLIYTVWLPKIRTAVNHWNVLDPIPMTSLVKEWRPLLPAFVFSHLIDQLIVPKLVSGLQQWDPRKRKHHHKHDTIKHAHPHTWIFPWLPYLPPYHLDAKASNGLLVEIKRRIRAILDTWDVSSGLLAGLDEWRNLLRVELENVLVRHLLPRLAVHLSAKLDIDPSDQDLTPLEDVLKWQGYFKPEIPARLLVAEFFPKWLSTLHLWLTTPDANFEEIGQWFTWWKQQLPENLSTLPDIATEWSKGTQMINDALDLLDQNLPLSQLPPPAAGPAKPIAKQIAKKLDTPATTNPQRQQPEAADFKDIVEAWCAEEDLTMVPLREAHPKNGLPIFRITASATGKGGVVVFLQGDVVWAQRKGDRSMYDPIGLEEKLVARAEGR